MMDETDYIQEYMGSERTRKNQTGCYTQHEEPCHGQFRKPCMYKQILLQTQGRTWVGEMRLNGEQKVKEKKREM